MLCAWQQNVDNLPHYVTLVEDIPHIVTNKFENVIIELRDSLLPLFDQIMKEDSENISVRRWKKCRLTLGYMGIFLCSVGLWAGISVPLSLLYEKSLIGPASSLTFFCGCSCFNICRAPFLRNYRNDREYSLNQYNARLRSLNQLVSNILGNHLPVYGYDIKNMHSYAYALKRFNDPLYVKHASILYQAKYVTNSNVNNDVIIEIDEALSEHDEAYIKSRRRKLNHLFSYMVGECDGLVRYNQSIHNAVRESLTNEKVASVVIGLIQEYIVEFSSQG